ncbi:hypothetical protein HB779_19195 [Phyllobacterium sp. 628]|uniref:HNH endonuclease n=1 Tax=Phyllobacterium sp. 628 TaxID=2718938 RepID=UPI0016624508|nr:HNH endonuclease [Phyllobacterium sp. 628]QND53780.1 hypothetical protein HB779_19195 [Phyllobacterium sp. 628]
MAAVFHVKAYAYQSELLERRFPFRNKFLDIVRDNLNDWIIYYQPKPPPGSVLFRRSGYFAAARITGIFPERQGYSCAELDQFIEFRVAVPLGMHDPASGTSRYFEDGMQDSDGSVNSSRVQQEVRAISDLNYQRILEAGVGGHIWNRIPDEERGSGFAEDPPASAERTRILLSRPLRDRIFRHVVSNAYGLRCAMTGVSLRTADGRHEIECAHIMPVVHAGPDSVRNGIALSRSVHWMFDNGLVSIGEDYKILKSRHTGARGLDALFHKSGYISVPKNRDFQPRPEFLRYHRAHIFVQR